MPTIAKHRATVKNDVVLVNSFAGQFRLRVTQVHPKREGYPQTYSGDVLIPGTFESAFRPYAITFGQSQVMETVRVA